jgi:hypothetical protein
MKWMPLVVLLAACGPTAGRYAWIEDPASRNNLHHVHDNTTGKWVYRECELRVDKARDVRELQVQLFHPGSAQSGGVEDVQPELRDGDFVWRIADALEESDFAGRTAYGIQPQGQPMEVIRIPPLRDVAPGTWSEWLRASDVRDGAFGWWQEAQGAPRNASAALPEHPFELRCRLMLNETPSVP